MYWRPVLTGQATKLLPNCGLPMSGCGRAEPEALVERLDKAATRYKMNMLGGAEKVKPVTNRAIGIRREKYIKGQTFGTVTSSNVLGQLTQMMAPNIKSYHRQHKPSQL